MAELGEINTGLLEELENIENITKIQVFLETLLQAILTLLAKMLHEHGCCTAATRTLPRGLKTWISR
jgi:hypothetical protein